jgi:hypothetical protein
LTERLSLAVATIDEGGKLDSLYLFDNLASGECDLPIRRHAQESRPDHQGRIMSAIRPISARNPRALIGVLTCRAPKGSDV